VEFALVSVLLVMLLFGVVELSRMVLVYTTIANAARAGTRYAIVHGSDNTATPAQIKTVVQDFLSAAPIDPTRATMPDPAYSCKDPGCSVEITVTYPYDPLISYFPISGFSLTSTSKGVITY
jgi:Flp pilus assembly protein TadG